MYNSVIFSRCVNLHLVKSLLQSGLEYSLPLKISQASEFFGRQIIPQRTVINTGMDKKEKKTL